MKKKQLIMAWVIGLILLSGCATPVSINRNVASINYSDGIDEQEAKYIAQKYCLDNGIRGIFISSPEVEETFTNPRFWEIRFQEKDLSQLGYHYTLSIDKKTGEVTCLAYGE
jgi:hypothetical protein